MYGKKIISLCFIIVFIIAISIAQNTIAEMTVSKNASTLTLETQYHKHDFTVNKKFNNKLFWVLSAFFPPAPEKSIIYFYPCAVSMVQDKYAPKSTKTIDIFKKAKKRQILIDPESEKGKEYENVMKHCKRYYLVPQNDKIRTQLKKIKFNDTLELSGYVIIYNSTLKENKPAKLAPAVAKGPFLLITNIKQ